MIGSFSSLDELMSVDNAGARIAGFDTPESVLVAATAPLGTLEAQVGAPEGKAAPVLV